MCEPASIRPAATALPASSKASWLAAQGRLPLAFMWLGLAWIVAASAALVVQPGLLGLSHILPSVIALTHAWILGFFVTVACGAVYQLAPVALGTTLWSERLGWCHFYLHALGVPGMVYAFWHWQLSWLGIFGSAVVLGIVIFTVNTWITVWRSTRRNTVAWSILLATGWLALTVLAGLLLVANRRWGFIPLNPLSLLRAHAHLGLVGFFITLLQGVGFQLIPMFTLGEVRDWRLAKAALWLTQLGLGALVPALLWQWEWPAFFAALAINAGLIVSGIGLQRALTTRKKRRLDPGLVAFLRGGAVLCAAALVGTALAWPGVARDLMVGGFNGMTYAVLGILGGLLPCVVGMMCKVVPFLTWMRAYGPRVGRSPTPAAHTLTHPRIERWGLALQHLAVVPLLVGVWTLNGLWLRLGVWLLAAGVILFTVDILGVLKHLWAKPVAPVSAPVSAPKLKPIL